jgi:hypothetical protein
MFWILIVYLFELIDVDIFLINLAKFRKEIDLE